MTAPLIPVEPFVPVVLECPDATCTPPPCASAPSNPTPPDSISWDVNVIEAFADTVTRIPLPGETPSPSIPTIITSASSSPGFTSRKLLIWSALLPGLNVGARCVWIKLGAASCMVVRNPSSVRTYASTSIFRSLVTSRRPSPWPGPPRHDLRPGVQRCRSV